jgi:hypothetical protein
MTDAMVREVADAMFAVVKETAGMKKLSPSELTKMMTARFGAACTRDTCKQAIRELVDSGRCTYTYFGGTYLEVAAEQKTEA